MVKKPIEVRFIDLFAGLGGIRLGLEQALKERGFNPKCVFTAEIKKAALDDYERLHGPVKHRKKKGVDSILN